MSTHNELAFATLMQHNGRPDVACRLLQDTPANSNDADRLYVLARCSAELRRIDDAIAYYQRVIVLRPDDANARVELAAIYMALGQRDKARTLYKETLPLLPAGQVSTQMRNLIEQLGVANPASYAQSASGKPWSIEVFAGVVHDSNINGGPVSNIIPATLGGSPISFTLGSEAMPQSSWGATGSVTGTYVKQLDAHWSMLLQGALSGIGYFSTSDFNNQYATLSAAFIYREKNWNASIQPNARYSWQDGVMQEAVPGVTGRFARLLSPALTLTGTLGYIDDTIKLDHARDGTAVQSGLGLIADVSPMMQIGGQYDWQRYHADDDVYSRRVYGPSVFAAYKINSEWTVVGNYSYMTSKYDQGTVLFPDAREDTQKIAILTGLWDISRYVGRNMVMRAQYMNIRNPSNIAYNDYRRNQFSLGVQTQF